MTADPAAPAAPRAPFGPGAIVAGRYRIVSVLGEGASGVVYVAVDEHADVAHEANASGEEPSDEPRVALKVIHRHLVRDRQIQRRFLREASILRRLEHESIVRLLDFGEDDTGLLFMALELVQGRALDEIVADGPISLDRAATVVRQVCGALEVAHAAGVVHRDLKPGNVLLETALDAERGDGTERARVLDFGMAKVLRGDAADSITALTEQDMVFGTPEYMAPEQARGDEVDARADVYATGILLYELLTGSVPFRTETAIGTMTAHLVHDPDPPSQRCPEASIPAAVESVILHALAKQRGKRYSTAAALRDALDGALRDPTDVESTRPSSSDEDLALQDTQQDLSRHVPPLPETTTASAAPNERAWALVAVVGALLGIAAGVLFSLLGG